MAAVTENDARANRKQDNGKAADERQVHVGQPIGRQKRGEKERDYKKNGSQSKAVGQKRRTVRFFEKMTLEREVIQNGRSSKKGGAARPPRCFERKGDPKHDARDRRNERALLPKRHRDIQISRLGLRSPE